MLFLFPSSSVVSQQRHRNRIEKVFAPGVPTQSIGIGFWLHLTLMYHQESFSSCAIVVSYNPEISGLLSLLRQLGKNGCDFLLIDNHSNNLSEFANIVAALPYFRGLKKLPENLGLAKALNIGLCHLQKNSYRFAFLFDQDSDIGDTFCADMLSTYQQIINRPGVKVAALGPRIQNPTNNCRTAFKRFDRLFHRNDNRLAVDNSSYHADFLITSGTLLPLAYLPDIGFMKEDYFIDNIDLEWCFRARAKGYELYGTDRAVLFHRIGETNNNPFVRAGLVTQHNPLRSYYTTRNRLNLYGKSYAPLNWKIRDFCRFVIKTFWLLLFSSNRSQYWQSIRKGIADHKALTWRCPKGIQLGKRR